MVREELEEMKRRKGSLARGVSYKSPWGWGGVGGTVAYWTQ